MYYVYVLESITDYSWYVGYSTDLKKRLKSHNDGNNSATRPKRPWKIIFYEAYLDKGDAKRREKYLKTTKGKTTLRSMLKNHMSVLNHD